MSFGKQILLKLHLLFLLLAQSFCPAKTDLIKCSRKKDLNGIMEEAEKVLTEWGKREKTIEEDYDIYCKDTRGFMKIDLDGARKALELDYIDWGKEINNSHENSRNQMGPGERLDQLFPDDEFQRLLDQGKMMLQTATGYMLERAFEDYLGNGHSAFLDRHKWALEAVSACMEEGNLYNLAIGNGICANVAACFLPLKRVKRKYEKIRTELNKLLSQLKKRKEWKRRIGRILKIKDDIAKKWLPQFGKLLEIVERTEEYLKNGFAAQGAEIEKDKLQKYKTSIDDFLHYLKEYAHFEIVDEFLRKNTNTSENLVEDVEKGEDTRKGEMITRGRPKANGNEEQREQDSPSAN